MIIIEFRNDEENIYSFHLKLTREYHNFAIKYLLRYETDDKMFFKIFLKDFPDIIEYLHVFISGHLEGDMVRIYVEKNDSMPLNFKSLDRVLKYFKDDALLKDTQLNFFPNKQCQKDQKYYIIYGIDNYSLFSIVDFIYDQCVENIVSLSNTSNNFYI